MLCDFLSGIATHTVSVVAHTNQQGAEEDGIVETVPSLSLQHKSGGDQ